MLLMEPNCSNSPEFGLRGVVIDSGHEECLEGVLGDVFSRCGVPERDLLLQLVRYLLLFLLVLPRHSLAPPFDLPGDGGVLWPLPLHPAVGDERADAMVLV